MDNHNKIKTKENLIIFIVLMLGITALAGFIEPLTVAPGAEGLIS